MLDKEKISAAFDEIGFYELEEIEKDFELNQEIIKVRNKAKQFLFKTIQQVLAEGIGEEREVPLDGNQCPSLNYNQKRQELIEYAKKFK